MLDPNTIQELLISVAWLTPVLVALVAVVRKTTNLTDRWVPLTSVVLGAVLGIVAVDLSITGGFAGVIIGLTASGLYDNGRSVLNR